MSVIENQARSLFLTALERGPDEWPAFLEQSCGVDAALRDRVHQLLLEERLPVWLREPDSEAGQKMERALVRQKADPAYVEKMFDTSATLLAPQRTSHA
jgi:hypothetical protein